MIRLSCLNVHRRGTSTVGQLDYLLQQGPPQIIALSEVNVPETAAIGYRNQWKARGRHVALSIPDTLGCRVGLVSDFPFRQVQLCKGPAQTRHVAGLFDLHSLPADAALPGGAQREAAAETILIVAFYGQAGNEAMAQSQVEEVLACAETSGFRYVILGDFNLEPCQGRLGSLIAQGATVAGDECARGRPLPGTGPVNNHGERTRRIDFALNHRALPAVSVDHFDCDFSDHLGVHYTYALDAPRPWTGPRRRAACSDIKPSVLEAKCDQIDAAPFEAALASHDLDGAWRFLSDAAEDLLCEPLSAVCAPRASSWVPRQRKPTGRSGSQLEKSESLRLLLKLRERLRVLSLRTADAQLLGRIRRSLRQVRQKVPDLPYVPAGDELSLIPHVDRLASSFIRQEEEANKQVWRARARTDLARARSFVKRRADEQLAWERQLPDVADRGDAAHPAVAVKAVAADVRAKLAPASFTSVDARAMRALLQPLPRPAATEVSSCITPEALRHAMRVMQHRASGPDSWKPQHLHLLPFRWWEWTARLWNLCISCEDIPAVWAQARIVMIKKTKGGYRPLTVSQAIWRAGARVLNANLAGWIASWISPSDAGGVPGTSVQGALLQLNAAMRDGVSCAVQQDIAGFFDAIQLEAVEVLLCHLKAPAFLWPLLRSFYMRASRIIQLDGAYHESWFRPLLGIAQGCPLSPTIAAAFSHLWTLVTLTRGVSGLVYLDDRSLWTFSQDLSTLHDAVRRSDNFDAVCGLTVSLPKCAVVAATGQQPEASTLARRLGYKVTNTLEILGVKVSFDGDWNLLKFSLRKALLRLDLLRWVTTWNRHRCLMLKSLVYPCLNWAAAYALPSRDEMAQVRTAVIRVFDDRFSFEAPRVLIFEHLGWDLEPQCAADTAVLREAWRLLCKPPAFALGQPRPADAPRWDQLLPAAPGLLRRLGWSVAQRANGAFFQFRDDVGEERAVQVGWETFDLIKQWLHDHYRHRYMAKCRRVWQSFHRSDPTLARGLDLPPPSRDARFRFRGHVVAMQEADTPYMRRAAAATGGTCWFFTAGQGLPGCHLRMQCLCGAMAPSRPHLTWSCESTAWLRQGHTLPVNRAEERLFARHSPLQPKAPDAMDLRSFQSSLDAAVSEALHAQAAHNRGWVYIATDGSSRTSVGAFAVVVGSPSCAFSMGTAAEDQSPYRQEVMGLCEAFASICRVWQPGCVPRIFLLTDCKAAQAAIGGNGYSPFSLGLLLQAVRDLRKDLVDRGCDVSLLWVPSHGKHQRWRPAAEHDPEELRALNHAADVAAGECMQTRLSGSLREGWHAQCAATLEWELKTIRLAAACAEQLHQHVRNVPVDDAELPS